MADAGRPIEQSRTVEPDQAQQNGKTEKSVGERFIAARQAAHSRLTGLLDRIHQTAGAEDLREATDLAHQQNQVDEETGQELRLAQEVLREEKRQKVLTAINGLMRRPADKLAKIRGDTRTTRFLQREGRDWRDGIQVLLNNRKQDSEDDDPHQQPQEEGIIGASIENYALGTDESGHIIQRKSLILDGDGNVKLLTATKEHGHWESTLSDEDASETEIDEAIKSMQELHREELRRKTETETFADADAIRRNGREVSLRGSEHYFNLGESLGTADFQSVSSGNIKTYPVYAEIAFQPVIDEGKHPMRAAIVGRPAQVGEPNATKEFGLLVYEEVRDGIREVSHQSFAIEEGDINVSFDDVMGNFVLGRQGNNFAFIGSKEKGEWKAILPEQHVKTKVLNTKRRLGGDRYSEEWHRRKRNTRRITLASAALASLLMNGGPIDQITHHHDAGQYVLQLGAHDTNIYHDWKSVAEAMQNLDNHNYTAIHEKALSYAKIHEKDFLQIQNATSAEHAIDAASTTQEVIGALNSVLSFYGKDGQVVTPHFAELTSGVLQMTPYDNKYLSNLRNYAKTLIGTLQMLPKPLVDDMDFKTFYFASDIPMASGDAGGAYIGAGEDKNDGFIAFNIKDDFFNRLYNLMPGLGMSREDMMRHEMGHSTNPPYTSTDIRNPKPTDIGTAFNDQIVQRLWGSPRHPSIYGGILGSTEEQRAEDWRKVFSGDVADPDSPRLFHSPANKELLEVYAYLAGHYGAGVVDYLIDSNHTFPKDKSGEVYLYMFLVGLALKGKLKKNMIDPARDMSDAEED